MCDMVLRILYTIDTVDNTPTIHYKSIMSNLDEVSSFEVLASYRSMSLDMFSVVTVNTTDGTFVVKHRGAGGKYDNIWYICDVYDCKQETMPMEGTLNLT